MRAQMIIGWETRTLFDNHVELQSSMSRSQVVDYHGNQSIVNEKLLSLSLVVGPHWNNFISRDQRTQHNTSLIRDTDT